MKISHRLVALSAFGAAGLLCVAGVSYVAVTSIQSDLQGLTLRATPLQNKTYEMQERTERMLGSMLRLSLVHSKADADSAAAAIAGEMQAIDKLRGEIQALDPAAQAELGEFRTAQTQILQTVERRLADDTAYRADAERARAALDKAAEAVGVVRTNVNAIGVEAGKAADKAQDATRRLAQSIKLALTAQSRLKELAIAVNETDAVTSRFRLTPVKEKVKAAADAIGRLETEAGSDDVLKDTRTVAASLFDAFAAEPAGLFSLRANQLASKPDADAAYQKQRKAILGPLDEQAQRLNTIVDSAEVQAFKQRQTLEAALKLRNEPGGVVASSEEVSLDIREMVGTLRLLMLAANEKETLAANAELGKLGKRLQASMGTMRAGLVKMGRPQLVQHVDAALAAMGSVGASVDKVGGAKKSLLASEKQLAESLASLKAVAARQASLGAAQVKTIAERQTEITAAVDRRVESSLFIIIAIAGGIIAATGLLSWRTVRVVTRRLDQAVEVAEAVSRGSLEPVTLERGNDETARLLSALGSMVETLTGIVGNIRQATQEITTGSGEMTIGNQDLSARTEQQASSLQQTAAAMEQLSATVRQNADTAQLATTLSNTASGVAAEGRQIVEQVASTMSDIQASSKKISEIIGVIDGIAFQTNILALNAAVEAARAGEHGRGFAVVASEVRALAMKSAEAAQQIKTIITASAQNIDAGSALVKSAGSTMGSIVGQVTKVTQLIGEIARASQEQATSVGQVGSAVSGLDEMTQRNAALAEQGTAAAMSLAEQAQRLSLAVAVLRLPSGHEHGEAVAV